MVAPQGDHGASECEAGVGLWDLNGVNDVRAPFEPRASLIVGAPFTLHAPQATFISFPGDGLGGKRNRSFSDSKLDFRTTFLKEYGIRTGFQ